jgi:hypothetical protein
MRERLTQLIKDEICVEAWDNGEFIETKVNIDEIVDRLLANVVIPLCKVGDTVYQVDTLFKETIITELTVIELTIDSKGIKTLYGMTNQGSVYCFNRGYNLNDIKFTKEEAEQALKEGEQ